MTTRQERHDGRLDLPAEMARQRIVAVLPDVAVADLMAPMEVMIQEGVTVMALPGGDLDRLATVAGVFGHRACLGVHGSLAAEDVDRLADLGIAFALVNGLTPPCRQALADHDIFATGDALTPSEVRQAWDEGVDAVEVLPADVASPSYGQTLHEVAPGIRLIPRGGLGSYALRQWLQAGAPAACLDEILVGDACESGTLSSLRERCRSVRAIVADLDD